MNDQLKVDFKKTLESLKLSKRSIEQREKNLNQFIENGFPNKRVEDWKFSDLNQIISSNIKDLSFYNNIDLSANIDQSIYINNFVHNKIVFINGAISNIDFLNEEKNKIEIIKNLDFKDDFTTSNSLVSLNSALITGYIKITVKENYSLNKPLIIYSITNKELNSKAINIRTDITLEKNSTLKLINILDDSSENNFINIYQKFNIGKDSILKSYKIDQKKNSNIKYFYNNINLENNSVSENFIF